MNGNIQIQVGGKIDTGKKWIDANGAPHVIYRKTLSVGALPNATSKNVAHGEAVSLTKYHKVEGLFANNGTTVKTENSSGITVDMNATNVVITTATDLSLYVGGVVTIEFCL